MGGTQTGNGGGQTDIDDLQSSLACLWYRLDLGIFNADQDPLG